MKRTAKVRTFITTQFSVARYVLGHGYPAPHLNVDVKRQSRFIADKLHRARTDQGLSTSEVPAIFGKPTSVPFVRMFRTLH